MRLIAAMPRLCWLLICVVFTFSALVAYDWKAEVDTWHAMSAANFPTGSIITGLAFGWLRNSLLWTCTAVALTLGWSFQSQARKSN